MSADNPVGRPTLYRPEYCNSVREWGRQGKSKAQMAAELGVARRTLGYWAEANPEFLLALEEAHDYALAWWENTGMAGLAHGVMNASVWSRSMAARFPADYREEHSISGPGGGPIITRDETHGLGAVKAALMTMIQRSTPKDPSEADDEEGNV